MGYYSIHNIVVLPLMGEPISHEEEEAVINNTLAVTPWGDYAFVSLVEIAYESIKWYNAEEDLKDLSLQFPFYLFELYREGEESMDFERLTFHNGSLMVREIGELQWVDQAL